MFEIRFFLCLPIIYLLSVHSFPIRSRLACWYNLIELRRWVLNKYRSLLPSCEEWRRRFLLKDLRNLIFWLMDNLSSFDNFWNLKLALFWVGFTLYKASSDHLMNLSSSIILKRPILEYSVSSSHKKKHWLNIVQHVWVCWRKKIIIWKDIR